MHSLFPLWLFATLWSLSGAPAGFEFPEPDLDLLLAASRKAQLEDLEGWRDFSFRREVIREKLDSRGAAKSRQTMIFRVQPEGEGFHEQLLSINGRDPTPREVRSHRDAGRFAKHYRQMQSGEADHELISDDLSLPSILDHAAYRFHGIEVLRGEVCYRLEIQSRAKRPTSAAQALADAVEGNLWLAVDGAHLVRWDTHLVRPVSRGLARLDQLDLRVEFQPLRGGWIPHRIGLDSKVKIGPITLRKRNRYEYSEFRRHGSFGS